MDSSKSITSLNRQLGSLKTKSQNLVKYLDQFIYTNERKAEFDIKFKSLTKLQNDCENLRLSYYNLPEDTSLEEKEKDLDALEETLQELEVRISNILSVNKENKKSENFSEIESKAENLKLNLPQIPLPEFYGSYEAWELFKSSFNSLITVNEHLSKQQKLYYLQASLKGEAKKVITPNDTFESLFSALEQRYQNKRIIAASHINSILSLNKLNRESASDLRNFVDNIQKHLRSLELLDLKPDNLSQQMLVNIVLNKLDHESRRQFEMTLNSTEFPDWNELISFLMKRCQLLESLNASTQNQIKQKIYSSHQKMKSFFSKSESNNCILCKHISHPLHKCKQFSSLSVNERYNLVKKNLFCINCLGASHKISTCKSLKNCVYCNSRHNSLLCKQSNNKGELHKYPMHENYKESKTEAVNSNLNVNSAPFDPFKRDNYSSDLTADNQASNKCDEFIGSNIISQKNGKSVLLSTVMIYCDNNCGNRFPLRGCLDTGSMISLITQESANALGLKFNKINSLVCGIGNISHKIKYKVSVVISNKEGYFRRLIDCFVVKSITNFTPSTRLDMTGIKIPELIKLSDKRFHLPGKLDMLIGNELCFEILKSNKIKLAQGNLILQDTVFGFTASGVMKHDNASPNTYCGLVTNLNELDKNIKLFWETENLTDVEPPVRSEEEKICDQHFLATHKRDTFGRFIVQMPFSKDPICLGDSKQIALRRLNSLWKRLSSNPDMLQLYKNFIQEYLALGHMELVVEEREPQVTYYLPHHGIYRPENTSTPLRTVFNASSTTSTGESLNSLQINGGVIQEDLFSILLRFRVHQFVLTADIKKMFRMISIDESQRDLLRIFWKNESDEVAKTYRLTTVTYGTTSAPYLATRSLKQLVIDDGEKYPLAAEVLSTDVYMDDIITGTNDLDTGKELQRQLVSLLKGACMHLHKWASNNVYLLPDEINLDKDLSFTSQSATKTLGLLWKPQSDSFSFKVSVKDTDQTNSKYTKKTVLSIIARLFDPLGLIAPVITKAKLLMQVLWQLNLDWEDNLPSHLEYEWKCFVNALSSINFLTVPRHCLQQDSSRIELHAFSDASERAYGAAIYMRCVDTHGKITVKLLCSKSKVAPLKTITIPRLELNGAVLLSKLLKKCLEALRINLDNTYLWTDSSIVLAWIKKPLFQLKQYVRNRVSIIQQLTKADSWKHVNSKDNPADLVSRGLDPNKIQDCDLWWYGPHFLHQEVCLESSNPDSVENDDLFLKEIKEAETGDVCALNQVMESLELINKCSSYIKLQRVFAWCKRFINNVRNPLQRETGCLKSYELSQALESIVKNIQGLFFAKEIQCLDKGINLPSSSNLLNLNPFLDSNGILRVGGRLKHSKLTENRKHPILLPSNHNFTYIVINYFHSLYFHTGAEATLTNIRMMFWIIRGRNSVRKIVKNCIVCRKVSSKGVQQIMADLPAARVTNHRVFNQVGIDYCGPFQVKLFPGRCKQVRKCFIAVFICFSVKAIHLEIVSDLTTESFLGALKRFIGRRGRPAEIFSDNGTNFVGANNELKKILKTIFKDKEEIQNYLANEAIKWHFSPPSAPHFGGLWEAGVKSLKFHLRRVLSNSILSYEEFLTLIVQIEAVLNSRPLCPLSNDPNDLEALTPAHFLIGSSLLAMPDLDYTLVPENRLNRWQLVQRISLTFWKKWSSEYLNRLQHRPKWSKGKTEFKEGDLVLVKPSENSWNLKWHLARIVKIHPGDDGIVRVVTLKCKGNTIKRAVVKIANLPFIN